MTNQNNQLTTAIQPLKGQRQRGESDNAVIACNDWLRVGTGRTLPELLNNYTELHRDTPPTKSIDTLKNWSRKFNWAERATEFDADYENLKSAERQAVMNYGAALDFDRVAQLKRLAGFLEMQIYELSKPDDDGVSTYHNIWVPDVKQIGSGDFSERVDIERFNASLIAQYRAVLDDIAKEVGGRVNKQELTGEGGGAIIIKTGMDLDDL